MNGQNNDDNKLWPTRLFQRAQASQVNIKSSKAHWLQATMLTASHVCANAASIRQPNVKKDSRESTILFYSLKNK